MVILLGLLAQLVLGPYSAAYNFSLDLAGKPDTRPGTWGTAEAYEHRITFNPPIGYRVRMLRVYGDVVAWVRGSTPPASKAGVLWGLQTTAPEGSVRSWPAADNCPVYVQLATDGSPARAAFNYDVEAGGLLEPDHILRSKVAVWLNDTGKEVHVEPTFVIVYRFERID